MTGLAACSVAPPKDVGRSRAAFTSAEAMLLDFTLDGTLFVGAADAADPRPLITAQLLYTAGPLNADDALGRYEQLTVSQIVTRPTPSGDYEVSYHATLPVAWGSPSPPVDDDFTVPARAGADDQSAFAQKYGATCVDPDAGTVGAEEMFLFYRPRAATCALDAADVVSFRASVTTSAGATTPGTYPEYQRIWADGALEVIAMFSQESEASVLSDADRSADEGVESFVSFLAQARALLARVQPDATMRTDRSSVDATSGATARVSLGATLADGHRIAIDVGLVGYRLAADGATFDAWYDALTPAADMILYNGHAGLGENVRTLMEKGVFRPASYVVWAVNGCDTFAYIDRTLAARRATLNPDDPNGTKYMDQVSNVMASYFKSEPEFSMSFIGAAVGANDPSERPEMFREIVAGVDRAQIVVITGDEDNEFEPASPPTASSPGPTSATVARPGVSFAPAAPTIAEATDDAAPGRPATGCSAGGAPSRGAALWVFAFLAGYVARLRRRRRRTRD